MATLFSTTANMALQLPTVSAELGPSWATDLNIALTAIDAHDHSSGKGVQVTAAGLNITTDLSFGSANATAIKSARFTAQGSPLSGVADLGCVYVSGADLYFNDKNGNQVRLTSGG